MVSVTHYEHFQKLTKHLHHFTFIPMHITTGCIIYIITLSYFILLKYYKPI